MSGRARLLARVPPCGPYVGRVALTRRMHPVKREQFMSTQGMENSPAPTTLLIRLRVDLTPTV